MTARKQILSWAAAALAVYILKVALGQHDALGAAMGIFALLTVYTGVPVLFRRFRRAENRA